MSVGAPSTSVIQAESRPRSAAWSLSRAVADGPLVAVIVLSLTLNVVGLTWGLPASEYFAWDIDGIAPLQPLVAAKRMFIEDWWNSGYYNKYPMGHFFVLMAAYAPYLGYLWLTGGLRDPSEVYPFGLRDPETALTVLSLIARSISALMGVGIVVLVYLTARRLAGRPAALFAGLTVAFSPAFIFYAHTSNVDTPSLFWCALGLFALGRLVAGHCDLRTYVLLGAAAGMAVATKEQTLGFFLFLPLSVLVLHAGHAGVRLRAFPAVLRIATDRKLLAGLGVALATFVVATHLIFNWHGNLLRLRWRLQGIHPIYGDQYPGSVSGSEGPISALMDVAGYTWDGMNPVLFVTALVGLLAWLPRHRWARHVAVPVASYLALVTVLAPMPFFRPRFVLQVILILALFAGVALDSVWRFTAVRHRWLRVPLLAVLAYSFAYGAETDFLLLRDSRYAAEAWLQAHGRPGATVEALSLPVYLPRFPRHLEVRHVLDLTEADVRDLQARAPDFIVASSAYWRRWHDGSEQGEMLARLLAGELGYRPVATFRVDPVLSAPNIPTLSPEIVILAR